MKKLWKSKWLRIPCKLAVGFISLLLLVICFSHLWYNNDALKRWERVNAEWEKLSDERTVETRFPAVADENNFEKHPTVVELLHEDGRKKLSGVFNMEIKDSGIVTQRPSSSKGSVWTNAAATDYDDVRNWLEDPDGMTKKEVAIYILGKMEKRGEYIRGFEEALNTRSEIESEYRKILQTGIRDLSDIQPSNTLEYLRIHRFYGDRARLHRELADGEKVLKDIQYMHKIQNLVVCNKDLISYLLYVALGHASFNVTLESLRSDIYSDDQLTTILNEVSKQDAHEKFITALEGEIFYQTLLSQLLEVQSGLGALENVTIKVSAVTSDILGTEPFDGFGWLAKAMFTLVLPREYFQGVSATTMDIFMHKVYKDGVRLKKYPLDRTPDTYQYKWFELHIEQPHDLIFRQGKRAYVYEVAQNITYTVAALQRHRIRNGAYPSALSYLTDIDPDMLLDPFSEGYQLKYFLYNGEPVVYSVFVNQKDDLATKVISNLNVMSEHEGDLVFSMDTSYYTSKGVKISGN